MKVDDCYQLGSVVKPHGLKGEIRIFLDVDYPEEYKRLESVYVDIDGKLIPFFIENITIREQKAVVKFEDVDDIQGAEALKGKQLYLPLDSLPELGDQQFYFHEIIGFTIVDAQEGTLGQVEKIYPFPNQDLMAVTYQSREVLIPINDDIIERVDKARKEIHVNLPDGLINLYLE